MHAHAGGAQEQYLKHGCLVARPIFPATPHGFPRLWAGLLIWLPSTLASISITYSPATLSHVSTLNHSVEIQDVIPHEYDGGDRTDDFARKMGLGR